MKRTRLLVRLDGLLMAEDAVADGTTVLVRGLTYVLFIRKCYLLDSLLLLFTILYVLNYKHSFGII